MHRHLAISLALALGIAAPVLSQDSASKDKSLDVRSSVGDLHVGKDADAKKKSACRSIPARGSKPAARTKTRRT